MATGTNIFTSAKKVVLRALYDSADIGAARSGQAKLPDETDFIGAIRRERKRCERGHRSLLLVLLDPGQRTKAQRDRLLGQIAAGWPDAIRETDFVGWYRQSRVIGVVFTDVGESSRSAAVAAMRARVDAVLLGHVAKADLQTITTSFYLYPEEGGDEGQQPEGEHPLYRDLSMSDVSGRVSLAVKRGIDILGSAAGLTLLSPLLLLIAIAVKLSSKGPVLFSQQRLGQRGIPFRFLKFRSMYAATDSSLHLDYIGRFIQGKIDPGAGERVYKITADPRVTRLGHWLRKTSLDELPQLWNVLKGEMSLVGPRPPIPYEFEKYDLWHRARLQKVKPGITGLWQVTGRSRLQFDEMVRLDLRYARKWSLWLDLEILAKTPTVVFSGEGAY